MKSLILFAVVLAVAAGESGVQSKCQPGCAYCKHGSCLQCEYGFCLEKSIVNNRLINVCTKNCGQGRFCNNGRCDNCEAGCAFCTKDGCAVCSVGFCLQETSSYGFSKPKCVLKCGKGSFCSNGKCDSCPHGCSKCSNKFQCDKCSHDYCLKEEQHNGITLKKCVEDCGKAEYCDAHVGVCQKCGPGCKLCSNGYNCHQCQYGFCKKTVNVFGYLNSVCLKDCGTGHYCYYGVCSECTIPNCTKCKNGYECEQCAFGYQLDYHTKTCVFPVKNH